MLLGWLGGKAGQFVATPPVVRRRKGQVLRLSLRRRTHARDFEGRILCLWLSCGGSAGALSSAAVWSGAGGLQKCPAESKANRLRQRRR